jgi:hypothetical protein
MQGGGVVPNDEAWAAQLVDAFLANDQWVNGGGIPGAQDLPTGGIDLLSKFGPAVVASALIRELAADQAAAHPSADAPPMVLPVAEPNQPASGSSGPCTQFGAAGSPGLTSQMPVYQPAPMDYPQLPTPMDYPQPPTPMDYPQPPPPAPVDAPQAVPDEEEAEVAQMVRVAMACGDMASTVWSEEENQLLRDGLSRYACHGSFRLHC